MLKNKVIAIIAILLCFGCISPITSAEPETPPQTEETQDVSSVNEAPEEVKELETPHVEDLSEMTPNANKEIREEVLADTNNELTFTIKKFLIAMICAILSAITIYFILSFIKNSNTVDFEEIQDQKKEDEPEEQEPQTPQKQDDYPTNTETNALKIFFEKTK